MFDILGVEFTFTNDYLKKKSIYKIYALLLIKKYDILNRSIMF